MLPTTADMKRVIRILPASTAKVDEGGTRDEALLLARLYAEEHFDRIYGANAHTTRVGLEPVPNPGNKKNGLVDGYQFLTTGGTRVSYEVLI